MLSMLIHCSRNLSCDLEKKNKIASDVGHIHHSSKIRCVHTDLNAFSYLQFDCGSGNFEILPFFFKYCQIN